MNNDLKTIDTKVLETKGVIYDIQHFSIHDGPGIRTMVFLKGCPLRCQWCHNPESVSIKPRLSFIYNRCIGCGYCFRVCPNGAHKMVHGKHIVDRTLCTNCGECTLECYSKALELVGHEVTVEEVLKDVLRDKSFYETSGGGMTLSGGEPTFQIDFTENLLKAAKASGLHCTLETCGLCDYSHLECLIPYTDIFLYDYKETDRQKHKEFTGSENGLILDNLKKLHDSGAKIILRCPVVPGLNDRDQHFEGIANMTKELPGLIGAEILFYHQLGLSKIDRFGLEDAVKLECEAPDKALTGQWLQKLRGYGARILNEEE